MGDEQKWSKPLQWLPFIVLTAAIVGSWYVNSYRLDRLEADNNGLIKFRELQIQVLSRLEHIERDVNQIESDIRELKRLAYQPQRNNMLDLENFGTSPQ